MGIHNNLNPVPFQEVEESLRRMVGMADGKHLVRLWCQISYRYSFHLTKLSGRYRA